MIRQLLYLPANPTAVSVLAALSIPTNNLTWIIDFTFVNVLFTILADVAWHAGAGVRARLVGANAVSGARFHHVALRKAKRYKSERKTVFVRFQR